MSIYEVNDPCNRTDIKEITCTVCEGSGKLTEYENELDPFCPAEIYTCFTCEGTGKIEPQY